MTAIESLNAAIVNRVSRGREETARDPVIQSVAASPPDQ